jgi:hypothetical protein
MAFGVTISMVVRTPNVSSVRLTLRGRKTMLTEPDGREVAEILMQTRDIIMTEGVWCRGNWAQLANVAARHGISSPEERDVLPHQFCLEGALALVLGIPVREIRAPSDEMFYVLDWSESFKLLSRQAWTAYRNFPSRLNDAAKNPAELLGLLDDCIAIAKDTP